MSSIQPHQKVTSKTLLIIPIFSSFVIPIISAEKNIDRPPHLEIQKKQEVESSEPVRCALTAAYYRPSKKPPKKKIPYKKITVPQKVEKEIELERCALTAAYYTPTGKPPKKITFYKWRPTKPEGIPEEIKEPLFTVLFSGYIKPEFFWDSRQVIGGRDDQTLIFPEPKLYDRCCRDINAHPAYDMLAIESRVRSEIIGPEVLEAKGRGYLEADFYGISEQTLNMFRMRHAYLTLEWQKLILLFGQYWHPLYTTECAPDTVSCNSGAPIDPLKRAPQFRVTKLMEPFEIEFTALSEINFEHDGPHGPSSHYLRNAVVPNLNIRAQARLKNHVFGVSIDFTRLVPRLMSDFNVKVEESVNSVSAIAYAAFNWDTFALRTKVILGQNCPDHGLIGGYAVHSIQPESDKRTYTNLRSVSIWADFNRVHKKLSPGCFIGYTKNIGASSTVVPYLKDKNNELIRLTYGFDSERFDYTFRVSPRLRWYLKPVVFGLELEYTRAAYGHVGTRGRVVNPIPTDNTRLLMAALYFF